jgi:hypothetical protein
MTDAARDVLSRYIEEKRRAASSKDAAYASLMKSGLYNPDGSLKAAYGGKKSANR